MDPSPACSPSRDVSSRTARHALHPGFPRPSPAPQCFQLSAEGTGSLNEFLITHGQGRPQSSLWDSLNSQSWCRAPASNMRQAFGTAKVLAVRTHRALRNSFQLNRRARCMRLRYSLYHKKPDLKRGTKTLTRPGNFPSAPAALFYTRPKPLGPGTRA